MFCTGLHRQPFLLIEIMVKINKSITIDEKIAKNGEEQAKEESRSFSSLIEFLLKKYLMGLKNPKSVGKK